MLNRYRVEGGVSGAFTAAVAGAVALVATGLFLAVGQPFGTVSDVALLVMMLSLGPLMLAHYELGGVVPLWPARLSLAGAVAAVAAWVAIQAAMLLGAVSADRGAAATGAFADQSVLLGFVGLWVAGASLLAGRWLPATVRSLGILAGLGTIAMAVGQLLGGVDHPVTWVGGIGYQVVLPVWALFLGQVFRVHAAALAASPDAVAT